MTVDSVEVNVASTERLDDAQVPVLPSQLRDEVVMHALGCFGGVAVLLGGVRLPEDSSTHHLVRWLPEGEDLQ